MENISLHKYLRLPSGNAVLMNGIVPALFQCQQSGDGNSRQVTLRGTAGSGFHSGMYGQKTNLCTAEGDGAASV